MEQVAYSGDLCAEEAIAHSIQWLEEGEREGEMSER